MDFLEQAFKTQYEFNKKLFSEKFGEDIETLTPESRKKWIKEFILSGGKEFYEMLDEIAWKQHTIGDGDGNNFLEEGIDTFKFLINCLIVAGFTYEEFIEKFEEKSFIVNFRYEQQKKIQQIIEEKQKICCIDIDGVLNNYPIPFLEFAKSFANSHHKTIHGFKASDYAMYKEIKHQYRLTGREALMPKIERSAIMLLNHFHTKGYANVLITARPYKQYNRLFYDTVKWLSNNQVDYTTIFFEREKGKFAIEKFLNNELHAFIDDDIENANRVCHYFKHTFLVKNLLMHDHSDYRHVNPKVHIVEDIKQIDVWHL